MEETLEATSGSPFYYYTSTGSFTFTFDEDCIVWCNGTAYLYLKANNSGSGADGSSVDIYPIGTVTTTDIRSYPSTGLYRILYIDKCTSSSSIETKELNLNQSGEFTAQTLNIQTAGSALSNIYSNLKGIYHTSGAPAVSLQMTATRSSYDTDDRKVTIYAGSYITCTWVAKTVVFKYTSLTD